MSGIYDVNLAAGAVQNVAVLGSYFKVRQSLFGMVEIKVDGGESYLLDEGLGVRMPPGKTFRDLTIRNRSGSAQTIILFVGDSSFEDTRVTGTVGVTNKVSAAVQVVETSTSLATGIQVTPIVAIGANLRGLSIRYAAVNAQAGAGGTSDIRIVASPTVPVASITPNSMPIVSAGDAAMIVSKKDTGHINLTVPSGWGLFCVTNHGGAAAIGAAFAIAFELL